MIKLDRIGYGAYGNIYSVLVSGEIHALKHNIKHKFVTGTVVSKEMSVLQILKHHPNIIGLKQVIVGVPCDGLCPITSEGDSADDVYFLFEMANFDLLNFIHKYNAPLHLVLKIIADIALGLEYMHLCGFIHRDIKPSNVLLVINQKACNTKAKDDNFLKHILLHLSPLDITAKICDFGFTKRYTLSKRPSTPGVVTLWYRAPEVISCKAQTDKLDTWSLGLLLHELLFGRCLHTTSSHHDESELTATILNMRPILKPGDKKFLGVEDWVLCVPPVRRDFVDIINIDANKKRMMELQVGNLDDIEDLLRRSLEIDPECRINVSEFLDHPLFDKLRSYITTTRDKNAHISPRTMICIKDHPIIDEGLRFFDIIYNIPHMYNTKERGYIFLAIDLFYKYTNMIDLDLVVSKYLPVLIATCVNLSYKLLTSFIDLDIIELFNKAGIHLPHNAVEHIVNVENDFLVKFSYQLYSDTIYTLVDDDDVKNNIDELYNIIVNLPREVNLDPLDIANSYSLSRYV